MNQTLRIPYLFRRPLVSLLLAVMVLASGGVGFAQKPAFYDNFDSGKLDQTKWIATDRRASGTIKGVNAGTFNPEHLDFSHKMLRIKLTQERGPKGIISTGGEIQSKETFGYGTYAFTMRMASTAETSGAKGRSVSGSDSSGFTFVNNSETELDIEFLGDQPGFIWLTNWHNPTPASPPSRDFRTYDKVPFAGLAEGFHKYKMVWAPGSVKWYIDGKRLAAHTTNVPSAPAHILINLWGTDNTQWGGLATVGVARYLYVTNASYTPLGAK